MKEIFRHYKMKSENGLISLEACIVLPIFIMLVLFVYGIMIMFCGQHLMAHTLIQSAESLSLDPYSTERLGEINLTEASSLVNFLYSKIFTDEDKHFSSSEKWYGQTDDNMRTAVKDRFVGFLCGGSEDQADTMLDFFGVEDGLDGLDFTNTKIEGNELTVTIKYKQEFIFNFDGLASFDREQCFTVVLWDVKEQ